MSQDITVELSAPIDVNGQAITALTFREAEVGDLIESARFETEMERTISVLASISSTPMGAFKKIKARDLRKIMAAAKELVGNETSPTTGSE
jgi:hypothetical protein